MFSWTAFVATVALVLVSAMVSAAEGTATRGRVTMGFLNHGGMWGDLLLMSVVVGLIFSHLTKGWGYFALALLISLAVTLVAHAQWAATMKADGLTCHVFPEHKTGRWYSDISAAGWMHIFVMTILLTMLLVYAISPMPRGVVFAASLILTAHVFLANVQPGWFCRRRLWTKGNFVPPILASGLIWLVGILKIVVHGEWPDK